jgi:opacity protein-like surface antigen
MAGKKSLWNTLRNCAACFCMMLGFASVCAAQGAIFSAAGTTKPLLLPVISLDARPLVDSSWPASPAGEAPPPPQYNWNDYRWELEAGATFVRFQSSIFYASMVGFKSSLSYRLNDWIAAEGGITTGFAPTIFENEHVKYLDYMVGVRVGPHTGKLEPWAHVMVGGAHLLPQTAGNSQNAFAMRVGIGTDYRLNPVLSLRVEADYLRTQFFSQSQNNFQLATGAVFHF